VLELLVSCHRLCRNPTQYQLEPPGSFAGNAAKHTHIDIILLQNSKKDPNSGLPTLFFPSLSLRISYSMSLKILLFFIILESSEAIYGKIFRLSSMQLCCSNFQAFFVAALLQHCCNPILSVHPPSNILLNVSSNFQTFFVAALLQQFSGFFRCSSVAALLQHCNYHLQQSCNWHRLNGSARPSSASTHTQTDT
jgi:hypothetical protein